MSGCLPGLPSASRSPRSSASRWRCSSGSRRHLGLAHAQIAPCLSFLLLQQRPSGCFGLFGPEQSNLPVDAPVATMLELPVTVECVWTLAEAGGSWRLFAALTGVTAGSVRWSPTLIDAASLP